MSRKTRSVSRSSRAEQVPDERRADKGQRGSRLEGQQPDDLRPRIVALAYCLYERRGRQDGHDLEDWLEAERQVVSNASMDS
ncbi:MAG: DUF2934 domain-containing protein [Nitrospiraceae bacterium]